MTTNSDPALLGPRTTVVQGIAPSNKASTYPTHYSDWAFGGLRTVNTTILVTSLVDRDSIPEAQRYRGLTVVNTGVTPIAYYRLVNGITNSDWTQYKTQVEDFVGTTRDDISDLRRISGMIVYIIDEDRYYRLVGGVANTNWVEFSSGAEASGLKEEPFTVSDWVETPTPDPNATPPVVATMLTIPIIHDLGSININVAWYESGSNGAVFVPWSPDSADPTNKIIGCIPLSSAFAGLVRITSSISSGGGIVPTPDVVRSFSTASWEDLTSRPGYSFFEVIHGLTVTQPSTEVYDNIGNEQLVEIQIESNERVRLIVNTSDIFSGYVHIRG